MKLKKLLSLLASLAMMVTAVTGAMSVSAEKADKENFDRYAIYTSGECGESAEWLVNSDGTLVISGSGEMSQCYKAIVPGSESYTYHWGWENIKMDIDEIIVEDGITAGFAVSSELMKVTKITLPSSLTKLNGCLTSNSSNYTELEDIYVYSKNATGFSAMYYSKYDGTPQAWHGSGKKWHVYKDSETDKSLRNDLKLTDEDIEYLSDDEIMPEVINKTPVETEPVTSTSGPAGINSKYEWNNSTKTLTFSGKGGIVCKSYYEKYAETAEHIVINSGITKIRTTNAEANASYELGPFYNFKALKDIQLPDTLTDIGHYSFNKCSSLTKIINGLPPALEVIDAMAFAGTSLEEVSFPESLNKIGEQAFTGTNIKSINLHEGMFVGGSAFSNCASLKEVTIPKNTDFGMSTIGAKGMSRPHATFIRCTGLEKIVIEDGCKITDAWGKLLGENGVPPSFCLDCTSLKTVIIKGDIDYIGANAFDGCTSLTDIVIYPKNLSAIEATTRSKGENNTEISFDISNNPTFHVVKGSTTEQSLKKAGYLKADNTVYLANFSKLETAISEAEAVDTSNYTDESVAKFTEALENAKATLENYDATQDEVNNAVKAIKEAKNALVEKPDEPSNPTDPSESDPSTPSDSSDPTSPSKPTSPTNPTGGNVKKTTSPAQKASEAKAAAEKAIKQAKITSLTAKAKGKKKITVSWKKVAKAAGYEVQASTKKNFKKNVVNKATTKNKIVFKKLKSKKKYFVRVRAYATYKDAKGKTQKVYSKWFKSKKKVKVK